MLSITQLLHVCTIVHELEKELFNVVQVLCFYALLCTKCFFSMPFVFSEEP